MRNKLLKKGGLWVLCLTLTTSLFAQQSDKVADTISKEVSDKLINKLHKKYDNLSTTIKKQNEKVLNGFEKGESRIQLTLQKTDSLKTTQLFSSEIKERFASLKQKADNLKSKKFPLKEYLPGTDSLQTSLSFLLQNKYLPADKLEKLKALQDKVKGLQAELQKANEIQSFVKERATELKSQLQNSGVAKQLLGINKQAYYYQQQLASYKELLNDKDKLKAKLLSTVRELPAFQKFWQKHSYLAALFPQQGSTEPTQALQGLQTRASVQANLTQRIGTTGGVNPQQYFQQQVSGAQEQLNALKDKLTKLTGSAGGGNSDIMMPDFKPNDQKTKTFLQRIDYGFNIQSEPGTSFLPTTSDVAITAGYKFTDKATAGFGASYKIGWGRGIKDIRVSSEGFGLRSYVDIKAKGSIWITGGFEYNYMQSFSSLRQLHDNVNVWQKSMLLGVSKKYKVGKKEGNIQVLYDFLHVQQIPYSRGLKFRTGYTF